MDLIILIFGLSVVAFFAWLITEKIPMDGTVQLILRIAVIVVIALVLIRQLGVSVPNVLH